MLISYAACVLTAVASVATGMETAATRARAPALAQEYQEGEIAA